MNERLFNHISIRNKLKQVLLRLNNLDIKKTLIIIIIFMYANIHQFSFLFNCLQNGSSQLIFTYYWNLLCTYQEIKRNVYKIFDQPIVRKLVLVCKIPYIHYLSNNACSSQSTIIRDIQFS